MSAPEPGVHGGVDELASEGEPDGRSVPPWVWRVVAMAVVVALAGLARPSLLSSSSGRAPADPTPRPTASAAVPPLPVPVAEPLRWAPRGDLVGSSFAAAALARFRQEAPDVDRLLWAGSLGQGDRVAVVAYKPGPAGTAVALGAEQVAALRVDAGDDATGADVTSIGEIRRPRDVLGVAWRGRDQHARLLLLGEPSSIAVQVSPFVDYRRDGTISRRWRDVLSSDGVAVVDLGLRVDPSIVVRPVTASSGVKPMLVEVQGTHVRSALDIEIPGSRDPFYVGPDPERLTEGVASALRPLFDLHDAEAKVLWDGSLSAGRATELGAVTSGRGALVWVRRQDGPVFQVFVFVDHTGALYTASANPVSWDAGRRLPYVYSTFNDEAPLYLVNPSGAGSVTVLPDVGSPKEVASDGNGVGVLLPDAGGGPTYAGARVVVHDGTGRTVLRSRLVDPGAVDGYGLYL